MAISDFVSNKRKLELERELAKEIYELKNNIICRNKFLYHISKNYSFIEFCYLYDTYLKIEEIITQLLLVDKFYLDDNIINTEKTNENYDTQHNIINHKIKDVRRIKRIENMALKGKKVKKRKK